MVISASAPLTHLATRQFHTHVQGLSLAVHNALAHGDLQRLAALDPLTGVFNRRFGARRLQEEFGRSVRSDAPLGALMFDIDHFKRVNDAYGHLVGDRVLRAVTDAAKSVLREGDVLVRYGGEEFLAILPAAASKDAALIAERLRRSVADLVVAEGDQQVRVTVSLGVASCPDEAIKEPEALIKLADDALYQAKQGGRDQVVVARAT